MHVSEVWVVQVSLFSQSEVGMTIIIKKIYCKQCKKVFKGVINDLMRVDKKYWALCPLCNGKRSFKGEAGIIESIIPVGAVEIFCESDN